MEKHIYNDKNGLNYTLGEDEYYYPDLVLPDQEQYFIGRYGSLHGKYLKENKRVIYTNLQISGKLNAYLNDIDDNAQVMRETMIKQMAEKEGVTEELKAENQMEWVGRMNNIRNRVEEIILSELIYH